MNEADILEIITIWALPVLLAITLHEAAHGWVALQFGDHTARLQGRISSNPLKHIDMLGTVVLPIITVSLSIGIYGKPFLFGWAKPVPVDPRNFRKPRQHMAWVAAAGPASNLIMAIFWALLWSLGEHGLNLTWIGEPLGLMAQAGIYANLILMALNLVPIPPLDGGRVMVGILKPSLALKYARIEPYGIFILLILIFTNVLGLFVWPIVVLFYKLLTMLAGV
jgi:Zn-dependent protease